jgi:hypothetical protein
MKPMSLTSPESIAREYKGNKKAIANAARMGLVDPTAALMAGMFIDRMRNAASEEQKTDTTVVQDTFGIPAAPQQPPQGMPQPQQAAPQPQMAQMPQPQGIPGAQMAAAQPRMAPGVEGLPTGDVGNYAGGGIVAFAEGMTDEQARALGYSSAAEYYAFQDIQRGAAGETAMVPSDNMEINRPAPEFGERSSIEGLDYGRLSPKERNQRRIDGYMPNEGVNTLFNQLASHRAQRGVSNPEFYTSTLFDKPSGNIPRKEASRGEERPTLQDIRNQRLDLNIPFNQLPRAGETTPAMADVLNRRQAMREALRLPGLDTTFNRAAPDVASRFAPTRSDLPPSVAARPEAPAPKPTLDAYGLPIPDPAANLALASEQAKKLINVPKEESQADAIAATKNLYREMGVDPDIYKKQSAKFEEERRGLKADKEEAKWSRLIEAGLGVMAGTSPFAAVNIGQGASPALKGFAQDIKDVKKADRELNRAQMALETTENQFKIDQSKSVQGRMEKNQDRVDKAQNTLATTTATLGASINTLTGSKYDAQLRDLTARATSENQLKGSMHSADQGLRGSLANAAATRFGYGRDEASIERIMAEQGVGYTEAMGIRAQQTARANDRYNSIRNSVNRVEENIREDLSIRTMRGQLAEAEKDPVANAAKITKLKQNINDAKDKYYTDAGISKDTRDYLAEEDKRILNQTRGRTNFDKDGKSSAAPPPGAIADLKANPTAQTKAQFDAIFGAGAADRALGTK